MNRTRAMTCSLIALLVPWTATNFARADDPAPEYVPSSVPVAHPRPVDHSDPDAKNPDIKGNPALPFLQLKMPRSSTDPKDTLVISPAGGFGTALTIAADPVNGTYGAAGFGLAKRSTIVDETSGSIATVKLNLLVQVSTQPNPSASGPVGLTGEIEQKFGGFTGDHHAANGYLVTGYQADGTFAGPLHDSQGHLGVELEGGYLALGGKSLVLTAGPIIKFVIQDEAYQKEQGASMPTGLTSQLTINQLLSIGTTVTQELLAARKRGDTDTGDKYLDASAYLTVEVPFSVSGEDHSLYLTTEGTARAVSTHMLAASPQDFVAPNSLRQLVVTAAVSF